MKMHCVQLRLTGAFDEEWMRHVGSLVYRVHKHAKPNGTTTSATALEATRNTVPGTRVPGTTTDSSTASRRCSALPVWSSITPEYILFNISGGLKI